MVKKFIHNHDIADAEAISARIARGEEETLPFEFVEQMIEGKEHPLRLWRKYRKMTLNDLSQRVNVSKPALPMIENGKSQPSAALLKKLSDALDCDMGDLFED